MTTAAPRPVGRPRKKRPAYVDVTQPVRQAKDYFLRAAAALTEWPRQRSALAFAIFNGALGMKRVADADHDFEALDAVERVIAVALEGRESEADDAPAEPESEVDDVVAEWERSG